MEKLVPPLEQLFHGTEVNPDVATIQRLFNGWKTHVAETNDATRAKIDHAARVAPQGLGFNQEGRKVWYNKMKEQNDEEWTNAEPAQAKWTNILTKIVDIGLAGLEVVETRWTQAEEVKRVQGEFEALAKKYGTGAMDLRIKRGVERTDEVKEMIQRANEKGDEWIE